MERLIRDGLIQLGLDAAQAPRLARYGQLLLEKNQVMNLTAIREPSQVARLHMLDCAALLLCAPFSGRSLIDVGTGAGFPGLVLKILEPSLCLTLLDSQEKRLLWLEEVCAQLNLTGVGFLHARAEELSHDRARREGYDYACARALAPMPILCELCLPFVQVGGRFFAMKSVDSGAEVEAALRAVSQLGGRLEQPVDYAIPGTHVRHRVVPVYKRAPTPPGFPRRWAKIQKSPL